VPLNILLLHNTADGAALSDLERHSATDLRGTDWKVWIDIAEASESAALSASGPVDVQIATAIEQAFAVVYFVGCRGPGPYQRGTEAGCIRQALVNRDGGNRRLRFVPVLLREGREEDLENWMRQYKIVNMPRNLTMVSIWRDVFRLIREPPLGFNPEFEPPHDSVSKSVTGDIVAALGRPSNLTLLIGPYGEHRSDEHGPAAISGGLLNRVDVRADAMRLLLPWPGECAEWARLGVGLPSLLQMMVETLSRPARVPSDLVVRVAALARRWCDRYPRSLIRADWNGLVLLSARSDLSLEAALLAEGVAFTRLVPAAQRRHPDFVLQNWRSGGGNWDPDPAAEQGPWNNIAIKPEAAGLSKLSLDDAMPVVLVKLCGSIDIDQSLLLTTSDIFGELGRLATLPQQLIDAMQRSPQLLVGHGFASPLGQLLRLKLLGRRDERGLPRVLVMAPAKEGDDSLIELEKQLLDRRLDAVKNAMDLSAVYRVAADTFVERLVRVL